MRFSLYDQGSIVLLLDRNAGFSPEDWIVRNGGRRLSSGEVLVGNIVEWFFVERKDRLLADYGTAERTKILHLVAEPIPYILAWSHCSAKADALLQAILGQCKAAIDNGHGLIASLEAMRGLPVLFWQSSAPIRTGTRRV